MSAMRTVHGFGKWLSAAALILLVAVGMACQSSSSPHASLSEYEKLVAKRRALSATPMSVRAQQEAEARRADDEAAARRAAENQAQQKVAEEEQARVQAAEEEKVRQEAEAAQERWRREAEEQARLAEEARLAAENALKEAEALPPVQVLPPPAVEMPSSMPVVAPASEAAPSARPSGMAAYTLGIGDAVQIYLRGIPQQDMVQDIIDETGMVSLPYINEIRAVGLTASELEQTIRNTYLDQKIYRNITVQVIVPTRFYYVQGATRAPGRFTMQSAVHVSEAIAAAGGGTDFWSGRVYIRRNGTIFKDIKNAQKLEKTPEDDILLEPGDIVELRERFW